MRIDALHLTGWRNYEAFYAEFAPGVNLICGDNAQGKTNLLEAICYLSRGSAFRTRTTQELIRFHAEYADLEAIVFSRERAQRVRAILYSGRRPRQLFLGGVKQRSAEALSGALTTVLFCPEDLLVLKKSAAERRKMINDALCQLRPRYAKALSVYNELQQSKYTVLREQREHPEMLCMLPDYNERMAQCGAILISGRAKYLRELERYATLFHTDFSGGRENLRLVYSTVSTVTDPFAPETELYARLREHQESHAHAELEAMQCLSGPHKDDFDAQLDGISIRAFGSQGQTRTAAISLKLAEREIFCADTGEEPVLLLDDVLSELDADRQDYVLNRIKSGQVFITCCDKQRLSDVGKTLLIEDGCLKQSVG